MMKVSIITCHNVYNAGASLQAYALVTYLNNLGYEAKIIDYTPNYLSRYRLLGITSKRYDKPALRELYQIVKFPGRLKKRLSPQKRAYDHFTRELPLTGNYHSYSELLSDPPLADVYIAGSDQIWNTLFSNGKDPAFYLDFVPAGKIRASYAASFATEDITEEWKPQIRKWLQHFDAISVRESSGLRIINNLGIPGAVQVCDPVFLLSCTQWEELEDPLLLEEPYLLVYDFDSNLKIKEFCTEASCKYGWKIYSILKNDYCDRCFHQNGPTAFLTLLRNAAFVVSNSFHAMAFSLMFQKQFVVFRRNERINTRMEDLLELLSLKHVLDPECFPPEPIDYDVINPALIRFVDFSKTYISSVMEKAVQHNLLKEHINDRE